MGGARTKVSEIASLVFRGSLESLPTKARVPSWADRVQHVPAGTADPRALQPRATALWSACTLMWDDSLPLPNLPI